MNFLNGISVLMVSLFLQTSSADVAVVAAPASNLKEYSAYLKTTGFSPISDVYLKMAELKYEEKALNECLETYWLPQPDWNECWQAVLDLSSAPYSTERKDLVLSLLKKLSPLKSPHRKKLQGLQATLIKPSSSSKKMAKASSLERKAWLRGLDKSQIKNAKLFVNGDAFPFSKTFQWPEGIFQWSLISDSHEPLTVIGTWQEFAAESVRKITPWVTNECRQLELSEKLKKLNISLAIYHSDKCLSIFEKASVMAQGPNSDSFQAALTQKNVDMTPKSSWTESKWILPVMTVVGVGLAAGLKNKRVTVQW